MDVMSDVGRIYAELMENYYMHYYTLDEHLKPRRCVGDIRGMKEYSEWHGSMPESTEWYIAKTGVGFQLASDSPVAGVRVSTVYLGLNHGWGKGTPVLWETMIFCDDEEAAADQWQERHVSHADAMKRHAMLCRLIASEGLESLTDKAVSK